MKFWTEVANPGPAAARTVSVELGAAAGGLFDARFGQMPPGPWSCSFNPSLSPGGRRS